MIEHSELGRRRKRRWQSGRRHGTCSVKQSAPLQRLRRRDRLVQTATGRTHTRDKRDASWFAALVRRLRNITGAGLGGVEKSAGDASQLSMLGGVATTWTTSTGRTRSITKTKKKKNTTVRMLQLQCRRYRSRGRRPQLHGRRMIVDRHGCGSRKHGPVPTGSRQKHVVETALSGRPLRATSAVLPPGRKALRAARPQQRVVHRCNCTRWAMMKCTRLRSTAASRRELMTPLMQFSASMLFYSIGVGSLRASRNSALWALPADQVRLLQRVLRCSSSSASLLTAWFEMTAMRKTSKAA